MNKKKNYTPEFRAQMVKEVEDVGDLNIVALKHHVSRISLYRWINGRNHSPSKPSTTSEILSLKKKLADADLENRVLKELLKKTNQAWLKD